MAGADSRGSAGASSVPSCGSPSGASVRGVFATRHHDFDEDFVFCASRGGLATNREREKIVKPHVIVGSLGGFLETGQLVKYPTGTAHNVILTAIAQGMGVQTDHVGEASLEGGDVSLLKA